MSVGSKFRILENKTCFSKHDYHILLPQHPPCAKNARSMHDTICHAWSNAHEHHILTTSVTAKASREHKDVYKRVSARSTLLPLTALCSVNSSKRNIENSMATASRLKRRGREHIEIDAALLPQRLSPRADPVRLQ